MNIAVCDDDRQIAEYIRETLEKHFDVQVTIYENADQMLQEWNARKEVRAHIVIMDIQLEQTDGISAAEILQRKYRGTRVIFITGYIDYATEIFRASPTYFLTKPIDEKKLEAAVIKALDSIDQEKGRMISCVMKGKVMQIDAMQIQYLESNRRNLFINEDNKVTIVNMKMDEISEQLPNYFLRCHQSYIVNMKYIKNFGSHEIELLDGKMVPVSRSKVKTAKEIFLRYLGDAI